MPIEELSGEEVPSVTDFAARPVFVRVTRASTRVPT